MDAKLRHLAISSRVEAAIDQVLCGLRRVLVWACERVERLENLPPSYGYEPMLVERGHGRTKRAISRRAAAVLEVWNTTSNLGNAFSGVDASVFEFVESLEAVARGDYTARERVDR
jgi:hypothetical protein